MGILGWAKATVEQKRVSISAMFFMPQEASLSWKVDSLGGKLGEESGLFGYLFARLLLKVRCFFDTRHPAKPLQEPVLIPSCVPPSILPIHS